MMLSWASIWTGSLAGSSAITWIEPVMMWSITSVAGVLVSPMLGFSPRRGAQSHPSDQPGTSVQCRMVDAGHRPGDQQAPSGHQEAVEHDGGHRQGRGTRRTR